jgi:hypothetical protein
MCWGTKQTPKDLGPPLARIKADIKRLVAHGNCELSQDQGDQAIRLVQMVKTYQPEVDELLGLEKEAAPYIRRCKKEGGWHRVAELLPLKVVRRMRSGIAKHWANVVLEAIVRRLKAEGYQSRNGESGEELFFGAANTPTSSTWQPTGTTAPDIGEPAVDRTAVGATEAERAAGQPDAGAAPAGEKPGEDGGSQGWSTTGPLATSHQRYERKAIMPSKCMNTLEVQGASSEVDRFVKRARGTLYGQPRETLLSFNATYPPPPEVLTRGDAELVERWQLEHWGCKSDNEPGKVTVRRFGPNRVEYRFETGEGPPLLWLERVAEDFPTLDFDLYYIAPYEVHGRRTYIRGELSQDWEEQPTAEDQARAGLLDEDYCATCGDPLGEDGQRCPHCELSKPGGTKASPQETAGEVAGQ